MRLLSILILFVFTATTGFSSVTVSNQVGTYANWATTWTAIGGGTDADDSAPENLDFVGDAANPGLYYNNNGSYVMFRMRVDSDIFTLGDAQLLLIDVAGDGTNGINYAFVWDSKSKVVDHGLEMGIRGVNGPTWGNSQIADIDGAPSSKTIEDINGNGRTTDGYVRTSDGQSTINFGNTTLIDFAVSWSYLQAYTGLRSNQTWSLALASIDNATDHNKFNGDIGGGASLTDDISIGWSAPVAIPEPASVMLVSIVGVLGFFIRRRFFE